MAEDNELPVNAVPSKSRRGCLWWIGRAALVVVALLIIGTLTVAISEARIAKQYPPPGELVSVGDHDLHLYCTGEGSPTVILEAGSGGFSLAWYNIQEALAEETRVCSYDRAGFGWSEYGPSPRDASAIVDELHTLLVNSDEEGPYVLVGASYGGMLMQMYAATYPDEVAGIVLVDSADGAWTTDMPPQFIQMQQTTISVFGVLKWVKRVGLLDFASLFGGLQPPGSVDTLPPDIQETVFAFGFGTNYFDTFYAESRELMTSLDQANAVGSLPDVPLIVLSHGVMDVLPPGMDESFATEVEAQWQGIQVDIANSVPDGTLIIAEDSGHEIQAHDPELVIDSILGIVREAR